MQISGLQRNFPTRVAEVRSKLAPEVWCQDEKNWAYRSARKGLTPRHSQSRIDVLVFVDLPPARGPSAAD